VKGFWKRKRRVTVLIFNEITTLVEKRTFMKGGPFSRMEGEGRGGSLEKTPILKGGGKGSYFLRAGRLGPFTQFKEKKETCLPTKGKKEVHKQGIYDDDDGHFIIIRLKEKRRKDIYQS